MMLNQYPPKCTDILPVQMYLPKLKFLYPINNPNFKIMIGFFFRSILHRCITLAIYQVNISDAYKSDAI